MMLAAGVECSAKIAMRPLCVRHGTTDLLLDIDQAQRICLTRLAMPTFQSHEFSPHDGVIEIAWNNR